MSMPKQIDTRLEIEDENSPGKSQATGASEGIPSRETQEIPASFLEIGCHVWIT